MGFFLSLAFFGMCLTMLHKQIGNLLRFGPKFAPDWSRKVGPPLCMHVASHAGRHLPRCDRTLIEKRTIDGRAGRVDMATDAG